MTSSSAEDAGVPPALLRRVEELLRRYASARDPNAGNGQMDSAIQALAALVAQDPKNHTALELLAIDALATGAFVNERDPERLQALADRACRELMALGNPPT